MLASYSARAIEYQKEIILQLLGKAIDFQSSLNMTVRGIKSWLFNAMYTDVLQAF